MGFSLSWAAFLEPNKTDLLQRAGRRQKNLPPDQPFLSDFCYIELPGDWKLIGAIDPAHWSERNVLAVSAGRRAIACRVEDRVMASRAVEVLSGQLVWMVDYDCNRGRGGFEDVVTLATMPPEFDAIKSDLAAEQEADPDAAYFYDLPACLAAAITGFRHDKMYFDWGVPQAFELEPA